MLKAIKVTIKLTKTANFYGAMGWSAVCDCGLSLSYSLVFIIFYVKPLVFYVKETKSATVNIFRKIICKSRIKLSFHNKSVHYS